MTLPPLSVLRLGRCRKIPGVTQLRRKARATAWTSLSRFVHEESATRGLLGERSDLLLGRRNCVSKTRPARDLHRQARRGQSPCESMHLSGRCVPTSCPKATLFAPCH
ncbi:conserved hypothetical protein [Ricinus communis]|uniref:Uncharacterized protein n=1 Tax=Ricinus communis TaxID=3988 RepID=B9T9W2_RICCO|nr:conserved hypothetical protein [Ricinus communis]